MKSLIQFIKENKEDLNTRAKEMVSNAFFNDDDCKIDFSTPYTEWTEAAEQLSIECECSIEKAKKALEKAYNEYKEMQDEEE